MTKPKCPQGHPLVRAPEFGPNAFLHADQTGVLCTCTPPEDSPLTSDRQGDMDEDQDKQPSRCSRCGEALCPGDFNCPPYPHHKYSMDVLSSPANDRCEREPAPDVAQEPEHLRDAYQRLQGKYEQAVEQIQEMHRVLAGAKEQISDLRADLEAAQGVHRKLVRDLDPEAIGEELGIEPGCRIAPAVLPGIRRLRERIRELEDALRPEPAEDPDKPEPCPVCGGETSIPDAAPLTKNFYVVCTEKDCRVYGPERPSVQEAIKAHRALRYEPEGE